MDHTPKAFEMKRRTTLENNTRKRLPVRNFRKAYEYISALIGTQARALSTSIADLR